MFLFRIRSLFYRKALETQHRTDNPWKHQCLGWNSKQWSHWTIFNRSYSCICHDRHFVTACNTLSAFLFYIKCSLLADIKAGIATYYEVGNVKFHFDSRWKCVVTFSLKQAPLLRCRDAAWTAETVMMWPLQVVNSGHLACILSHFTGLAVLNK